MPAGGAFLAPSQSKLQEAYKSELGSAYGIGFNRLLALNNMPIKRFADFLTRKVRPGISCHSFCI